MKDIATSPIFPSEWECQTPDCKRNPNLKEDVNVFLIDPFERKITSIRWDGDWKSIAKMLDCDLFDVARFHENGDCVFVDDEGSFRDDQQYFRIKGYAVPIAGKGLVLGTEGTGESVAPIITVEELAASVKWMTPQEVYQYAKENDL
jgi:hypothetical protein